MNFQEDIKKIKRLASISEEAQELVKQITGKELVSYEGIDALVAALMGFYNGELKKKSQTGHKHTKEEITDFPSAMTPIAHNHDDRYYTENETNDKLKQKLNKGNLPATITDAKEIYNLLENNSGLNFDKNLLFLNDKGVKTQGKIYFDRNKVGMFECIKTTPEDYVANSTTYFVDISNKSSSDRLSNLHQKFDFRPYLEINDKYISKIMGASVVNNILVLSFLLKNNINLTSGEYFFKLKNTNFAFTRFYRSYFLTNNSILRLFVGYTEITIDSSRIIDKTDGEYLTLIIPLC